MLNFKNIILFACFSKIIIIFVPLNFKNINDMRNFIEVNDKANGLTLVNVNHITVVDRTPEEGVLIHTSSGDDVNPRENYLQVKHLIEESYE